MLRPGLSFAALCEAMADPVHRAGFWYLSPLVHSVSPATMLGVLHGGVKGVVGERYPWLHDLPISLDATIRPGMLFSFEPNACSGRMRVNIGGTVAVGTAGPEELNQLCCRLCKGPV